jgi:homoserine kinase
VGALVAGNMLLDRPYGFDTILSMAAKIEGHPDNVAPALYGGMVIAVESNQDIITHNFDPPQGLKLIAVIPDFELPTKHARQILPENVPLKDAIYNVGRAALVTAALKDGDYKLLSRVMEDKLHQQYRTVLIPGMEEVFFAAKQEGAFGAVLSGAGPTLIAFADGRQEEIGLAMQEAFLKHGVKTEIQHLEPALTGAEILDI